MKLALYTHSAMSISSLVDVCKSPGRRDWLLLSCSDLDVFSAFLRSNEMSTTALLCSGKTGWPVCLVMFKSLLRLSVYRYEMIGTYTALGASAPIPQAKSFLHNSQKLLHLVSIHSCCTYSTHLNPDVPDGQ